MTTPDWTAIEQAVLMVFAGTAKHIRNDNWSVYETAGCIRIDLNTRRDAQHVTNNQR